MATTLTVNAPINISGSFAKSAVDANHGEAYKPIGKNVSFSFSNGTGNNQADLWYSATGLSAVSGGTDYDLSGSLSNDFNSSIAFATIKGLAIHNRSSTSTDTIYIGNPATVAGAINLFDADTSYMKVFGSGFLLWLSPLTGLTITNTSADLLGIKASVASITFDLAIWGVSA